MIIEIGGRGSGKTQACIEWLVENPDGVLVVPDHSRRDKVVARIWEIEEVDIKVKQDLRSRVTTVAGVRKARQMGRRPGRIAVDGLPAILADLLGGPVEFATLTAEGNSVQMGKGWEHPESDPLGELQKASDGARMPTIDFEISPESM